MSDDAEGDESKLICSGSDVVTFDCQRCRQVVYCGFVFDLIVRFDARASLLVPMYFRFDSR